MNVRVEVDCVVGKVRKIQPYDCLSKLSFYHFIEDIQT